MEASEEVGEGSREAVATIGAGCGLSRGRTRATGMIIEGLVIGGAGAWPLLVGAGAGATSCGSWAGWSS